LGEKHHVEPQLYMGLQTVNFMALPSVRFDLQSADHQKQFLVISDHPEDRGAPEISIPSQEG
jgi:hypothetical protein